MSEIIKFCIQNGMIPFDILTGTLYKYVNIETAKLILKNSSLKFSTADEFNDPFELTLEGIDFRTSRDDVKALVNRNIKGNREARRRIFKEKVKNIHIAKDLLPQIMSEYKKSFGICCFSKKYDKTLMWSHYANNHCGICFGFKGFFTGNNFLILNVQYIEKVEKYSFWKIKEKILPILAFRKSHIWEYEEEVRALHTEKHGLFKFNSSCLNEIYYGLKTKKSDIEEIDSLIKTMSYTPKKFKMKINPATYDIIREDY